MGCIYVDDGVASQQVANRRSRCCSSTQRDDSVVRQRIGDCLGFHDAKGRFSVGGENVCNCTSFAFDDEGICIDVAHAETLSQETPNL